MPPTDPWSAFERDPRLPQNASLRAGHRDRDVVRQVLTEAYGDGRLDRDELEQRTSALEAPITLGALAHLIADLVPSTTPGWSPPPPTPLPPSSRGLAAYESARRHALLGFLVPSVIGTMVYLATSFGGGFYFPWPLIVIAVTGMNLVRTLVRRPDIIAEAS